MNGYWYLATPYAAYPHGHEEAFLQACENAGLLMDRGIPVFCPIAHSHPISRRMSSSPTDHDLWVNLDKPLLYGARGGIFVKLPGFRFSKGMDHELRHFVFAKKPIIWMEPGKFPEALHDCGYE